MASGAGGGGLCGKREDEVTARLEIKGDQMENEEHEKSGHENQDHDQQKMKMHIDIRGIGNDLVV